jgi:hypothetical protein
MFTYIQNKLEKLNKFVSNSTNLFENTITIDENLSVILYNNKEHIGEKINPFKLRDLLEPDYTKIFKPKL